MFVIKLRDGGYMGAACLLPFMEETSEKISLNLYDSLKIFNTPPPPTTTCTDEGHNYGMTRAPFLLLFLYRLIWGNFGLKFQTQKKLANCSPIFKF